MSNQRKILLFYLILLCLTSCQGMAVLEKPGESKVCDGTNVGMSTLENHTHQIRNFRNRFENCTYVQGNLEITYIKKEDDLRFLSQIREVTGYVLIAGVQKEVLHLPSLRIIRGRTLFTLSQRQHALVVTVNPLLRELAMPHLQEVMRGDVMFMDNPLLCHVHATIDWYDILADNRTQKVVVDNAHGHVDQQCSACSTSCDGGFCWGGSNTSCQKRTKSICASQCHPGRCFGSGARDCCHSDCVAGCHGPLATDCIACKRFENDGFCVQDCPPARWYDQEMLTWRIAAGRKLAYGNTCVDKCPDNMMEDEGACVRECPEGKIATNGSCVTCDGPCPKRCHGFGKAADQDRKHGLHFITEITIKSFVNCTIIEGNLLILAQTFTGAMEFPSQQGLTPNTQQWHNPITPADLEQLSTIKEITGFVRIDATHPDITNLSFLRNLEVIQGRNLDDKFSLTISSSQYLTTLGLDSLKRIVGGGVRILENRELCLANTVAWSKLTSPAVLALVRNNRPPETCKEAGQGCHSECSSDGCWGKSATQCLSCANFKFGKDCIRSCDAQPMLFESGNATCSACHSQCLGGCHGPGADNCTSCLNVKDGLLCKPSCPVEKYKDEHGVCQPCSHLCSNSTAHGDKLRQGCTGPGTFVGLGGCRSCEAGVLRSGNSSETHVECFSLDNWKVCPPRHFMQHPGPVEAAALRIEAMAGKTLCLACHPLCEKCQGEGVHCDECVHFKEDGKCVANCSSATHYPHGKFCLPCHAECSPRFGCTGPFSAQCGKCKNKRDYYDREFLPGQFNCTSDCPMDRPHTTQENEPGLDGSESVCTPIDLEKLRKEEQHRKRVLYGCGIGLPVGVIGIALWLYVCLRKERTKQKSLQLMSKMAGIEESEPFTPTDIKPNTGKLRIFNENELRRGRILGQGAFGYVYQGLLVPFRENKRIPVAIKVLKDAGDAAANAEMMEEARAMATVQCSYLVPLIGICMTTPTIIITQLLPLGCLLDYVKKNKNQIKSKNFLNWCSQIARGMKYLEDAHLLHRDLAARNVLVQTPNWVKVTDFGLAKILGDKESSHKAGSGRMPVKWLAPECIERSLYSHKTDVWAFGVTVWEILTYGDKPYDNIAARNLLEKLEAGERLAQPAICSMDVYYLMLKCWSSHPENRPAFSELASEFSKMVRDPGRFLIIPGDEYLRLPDYTSADEQRMLRDFDDQGSEEFMTADEYINPGQYRFDASQVGTMKKYQNGHIMALGDGGLKSSAHSSLPVFTSVSAPMPDSRGAWSVDRKDSPPHSRYAMDPVKGLIKHESAIETMNRKATAVLVGPDDYLIPTDQSPTSNETYLDLTESLLKERDASLVEDYQKMPLASARRPSATPKVSLRPGGAAKGLPVAIVNNPEYLFSSGASDASTESAPSQTASNVPLAPDEEDSDHEYYNDFSGLDQSRREMIPLNTKPRRNETTV